MKDKEGNEIKRDEWYKTKNGFVVTTKDRETWQIDCPDGTYHFGAGIGADKLAMFFLMLGMGHDIDYAMKISCEKTRKYGKHRED